MSEWETLYRAWKQGASLSRFGDGEIRLAIGPPAKKCKTQEHVLGLQHELARMLQQKETASLLCLPRITVGIPLYDSLWVKFLQPKWCKLFCEREWGSSFISRPDVYPEINTPEYWDQVTGLWQGRRALLVIGNPDVLGKHYSLVPEDLVGAKSVDVIYGPTVDAYKAIEMIDHTIGAAQDRVLILCLGATATCLAERCAQRGIQSLDLGHIGRYHSRGRSSR